MRRTKPLKWAGSALLIGVLVFAGCSPQADTAAESDEPVEREIVEVVQPLNVLAAPVTEQEAEYFARRQVPDDVDEWLREVELGEYERNPYWMEVYRRAQEEGRVVVWATTSRVARVVDEFNEMYPGVTMEFQRVETSELVDKFEREYDAGLRNVDVILQDGIPEVIGQWQRGLLHKYVPPRMRGIVPPELQEGMLRHRSGLGGVLYYNTEQWPDGPDFTNLWALTRDEYQGRLILADPLQHSSTGVYLTEFLYEPNGERLAEAYEQEFGSPIDLGEHPHAGYVFLERIAKNARLVRDDDEVLNIVGAPGQENPPMGLWVTASKIRTAEPRGLVVERLAYDVYPTGFLGYSPPDDILTGAPLAIASHARHPWAARLAIDFLMGDADGGAGFSPWRVVGNVSTRVDVGPAEGDLDPLEVIHWETIPIDVEEEYRRDFIDFWLETV